MNGVRSIFRRKGYLLTALAAAVLLAASSGTAYAQQLANVVITIEAPRSMPEGGDATITVRGKANVLIGRRKLVTASLATERSRSIWFWRPADAAGRRHDG